MVVATLVIGGIVVKGQQDRATEAQKAAEQAFAPFQRLQSATSVGITYADYGRLVQNAQYATDSYEPKDARGKKIREWLAAAALVYAMAYDRWDAKIQDIGNLGYDETTYETGHTDTLA